MDLHTAFLHPSIYIVVNTQPHGIANYIEGNGLIQYYIEGNSLTEEEIRRTIN